MTLQDGHEERPRVPEEVGGEVGDQASGHGHDAIAEGRLGKPERAERVWSVFGACVERGEQGNERVRQSKQDRGGSGRGVNE